MFNILKQLQSDVKEVSILLTTPTDEWIKGFISYVDEDCISFETEARDNIYYTLVIKLQAIIAVEFISDVRHSTKDKFAPPIKEKETSQFFDEDDDYEEPFNTN